MRECQLRSGVNWQGALKKKGIILGLGVYLIAAAEVREWCDILFKISVARSSVGTQWSHDALNWWVKAFFVASTVNCACWQRSHTAQSQTVQLLHLSKDIDYFFFLSLYISKKPKS